MEKKLITASLGFIHLASAVENREPYLFIINGEPRKVIINGLEAVDKHPGTYDLKVTILDSKMPNCQHFRFTPATGQGEWIGYFELEHSNYADHVVTWENHAADLEM